MSITNLVNSDELIKCLTDQEKRIHDLEIENASLLCDIENRFVIKDELQDSIQALLPRTGILSHNLFVRAFSIWGHFLFAQIFISLIFAFGYLVIFILILKAFLPK